MGIVAFLPGFQIKVLQYTVTCYILITTETTEQHGSFNLFHFNTIECDESTWPAKGWPVNSPIRFSLDIVRWLAFIWARELLEECCVIGPLHLESFTWYKTTMQKRKGHIGRNFVLSQSIHRSQACLASSCILRAYSWECFILWKLCSFIAYWENFFFETTLNIGLKYFVRTFCFVPVVYYLVTIVVFIVLYW